MNNSGIFGLFITGLIVVVGVIAFAMWGLPQYAVWSAEMRGKAELAQAEQNRQIAVREAMAMKDAATLKAEAEVERAKGVAAANAIIADGLKGHDEYLRYLWIQGLENNPQAVIYVPTEAGLPILEAGKRGTYAGN